MKIFIPTLLAVTALPLMALGQAEDQQQAAAQGQTNESKEKAPAKKKKAHPANEPGNAPAAPANDANMRKRRPAHEPGNAPQTRPENGANMRAESRAEGHAKGVRQTQAAPRSSKTQTKVNVEEFKTQHREVFTLGRHPKDFFVQRFGANHFRLIGNTYFVFVDGCWVAVDVAGFVFVERVICEGDPDYIVVY